MENTINKNNEKVFTLMLYAAVLCVTLFPVSCNYIPNSGEAWRWTEWVTQYVSGETAVIIWRISMLLIQIGTLFASLLFFISFFKKSVCDMTVFFGVLLYMTCPYRIYVCYDKMDMLQAAEWMLLPLYAWIVVKICMLRKKLLNIIVICLLTVIFAPFFLTGSDVGLLRYVFTAGNDIAGTVPHTIMKNGYRFTEYFTSYAWRDGHPGMGMGMVICMVIMLWLLIVKGKKIENNAVKLCLAGAIACGIMAFYYFPWDFAQRFGNWSLKLISIIDTPAVFAGTAYAFLCVPGAYTVKNFEESEGRKAGLALKIIVLAATLGLCIYQCNMITYTTLPLTFE